METGSKDERGPLKGAVSSSGEGGVVRALLHVGRFYLAAVLLTVLAAAALISVAGSPGGRVGSLILTSLPVLASVGLITAFMVRNRGWTLAVAGWPQLRPGVAWFGRGLLLGIGMAVGAVSIGVMLGGGGVFWTGPPGGYVWSALAVSGGLLLAALAEELLFRGYPLQKLARAIGPIRASVLLALGFSALHLGNPEVTGLGLINIALASLVLSAVFFTPGSLAAAWGLHLGWNSGLMLLDAPVSGISFDLPGLDYQAGSLTFLTGGSFGPEGGLSASLVMIAALVLIIRKWI